MKSLTKLLESIGVMPEHEDKEPPKSKMLNINVTKSKQQTQIIK